MSISPFSSLLSSAEFRVAGLGAEGQVGAGSSGSAAPSGGGGFAGVLADQIGKLDASLAQASDASQQLATGQTTDVSGVVMAVEKATLELQVASQLRSKAVDAYQDLFRMQI